MKKPKIIKVKPAVLRNNLERKSLEKVFEGVFNQLKEMKKPEDYGSKRRRWKAFVKNLDKKEKGILSKIMTEKRKENPKDFFEAMKGTEKKVKK